MASQNTLFLLFSLLLLLLLAAGDDAAVMAKLSSSFTPSPPGWTGKSYCDWTGVDCDSSNRVTSINLASKSLSGSLPLELSQLSQLKTFALQRNSLYGSVPSFANISSLQEIFLDSNGFTSVPRDLLLGLTNLQTVSISDNPKLSPWEIPPYLTESSSLGTFTASNTSIGGSIPDFFYSFPNSQNLRLSFNNLTGFYPNH